MLQRRVSQDSSTAFRALSNSGQLSFIPRALPPCSFLASLATSAPVMGESTSESPDSASSMEDVLVGLRRSSLFLPLSDNISNQGQKHPTFTVHKFGEVRFSPAELPVGLPEYSWCQRKVPFHGLTGLLSHLSFCLRNHKAAVCLACQYLSAASRVPLIIK